MGRRNGIDTTLPSSFKTVGMELIQPSALPSSFKTFFSSFCFLNFFCGKTAKRAMVFGLLRQARELTRLQEVAPTLDEQIATA